MFDDSPLEQTNGFADRLSKRLADCCNGEAVTVLSVDPALVMGQRLRELGLIEGSQVVLLKRSDPLLILVKESRIAIDPRIAKGIKVFCECDNGQTTI
jgi:Fe2+ transport system protein FeoA